MNKKTLLLLLPVSCLLVACNQRKTNGSDAEQNSQAVTQDLTDEKVVERLGTKLAQSGTKLADKLNSVKLEAKINKLDFDMNMTEGSTSAKVSLKDTSGSFVAQVEDLYSPLKDIKAYVGIDKLAFSCNETITYAGTTQNINLSCDKMSVDVYKKDTVLYGDFSDKNISKFVTLIGSYLTNNTTMITAINSILSTTPQLKFDLSKDLQTSALNSTFITKTDLSSKITDGVTYILDFAKENEFEGIKYVEYTNGDYAVQLDAVKILENIGAEIDGLKVTKDNFGANLEVIFGSDYALKTINAGASIDMSISNTGANALNQTMKGEADFSLNFTYGEAISFPSFDAYQDLSF